jgi:hypothetical protein
MMPEPEALNLAASKTQAALDGQTFVHRRQHHSI